MPKFIAIIGALDDPSDLPLPGGGPAPEQDHVTFQGDADDERDAIKRAWALWDETYESRPEHYTEIVNPVPE